MKLRKLTQIGLNRFSNYLKDLRNDGSIPILNIYLQTMIRLIT